MSIITKPKRKQSEEVLAEKEFNKVFLNIEWPIYAPFTHRQFAKAFWQARGEYEKRRRK